MKTQKKFQNNNLKRIITIILATALVVTSFAVSRNATVYAAEVYEFEMSIEQAKALKTTAKTWLDEKGTIDGEGRKYYQESYVEEQADAELAKYLTVPDGFKITGRMDIWVASDKEDGSVTEIGIWINMFDKLPQGASASFKGVTSKSYVSNDEVRSEEAKFNDPRIGTGTFCSFNDASYFGKRVDGKWVTTFYPADTNGIYLIFDDDKIKYSEEWVDGKWYSADGTQTYGGTLFWKSDATGWWVEDSDGWYPQSQWQRIDGAEYYFKADGYMASGEYCNGYWFNDDGTWDETYYLSWKSNATGWWVEDKSGWWPSASWLKIDGFWYYFDGSGYMVTSQYVDGYWLGADGACQ